MNGPFRDLRMEDSGRLVCFPGPKILDTADLPKILSSKDLFARKFDAAVDRTVLEAVATLRGYPIVESGCEWSQQDWAAHQKMMLRETTKSR